MDLEDGSIPSDTAQSGATFLPSVNRTEGSILGPAFVHKEFWSYVGLGIGLVMLACST